VTLRAQPGVDPTASRSWATASAACAHWISRSGADIRGAISFHGLLLPNGLAAQPIKAKVLALHGYADPMVPPDQVVAFGKEMTDAGVDRQLHAYGGVLHAFTVPGRTTQPRRALQRRRRAPLVAGAGGFLAEIPCTLFADTRPTKCSGHARIPAGMPG
jgi:dienelactone hydrolase